MEHPRHAPIPNQLRYYRRRNNLRIGHVARLAGLRNVSHLAAWEQGRKLPRLENALKLSAIIRCPVEVLFFDLYDVIRRDIAAKRQALTACRDD